MITVLMVGAWPNTLPRLMEMPAAPRAGEKVVAVDGFVFDVEHVTWRCRDNGVWVAEVKVR